MLLKAMAVLAVTPLHSKLVSVHAPTHGQPGGPETKGRCASCWRISRIRCRWR